MVVGGVSGLEDKWGDVVGSEKMCGPNISVAVMDAKEEDLWIQLDSSTGHTEDTHFLHTAIPVYTYQRRVVDYPVTGEVPVNILGVIFCLVNNHRCHEALAI